MANEWGLPLDGGCRCGAVRFRIAAPPLLTIACHCSGCQRMAASAYSLTIVAPADGFALTEGETEIGGLHGVHRHHYCPHCKSWLFTRPSGMDAIVNVRATMLDSHDWYEPFIEVWASEALPWASTPATFRYETAPEADLYPKLIAAFATHGARPTEAG